MVCKFIWFFLVRSWILRRLFSKLLEVARGIFLLIYNFLFFTFFINWWIFFIFFNCFRFLISGFWILENLGIKIYELENNLFYIKFCKKVLRKLCFIFSISLIFIKFCLIIFDLMWEFDSCVFLFFCYEGFSCFNYGFLVWIYFF